MVKYIAFSLLLLFSTTTVFSQNPEELEDLRTIVTLLDYVSKDYSIAVENGVVIDEAEYEEQIDFANKTISLHQDLTEILANEEFASFNKPLDSLLNLVKNLASLEQVSQVALSTKNRILDLGILKISPVKWPSVKNGRELYAVNCASCHGENGFGDGPQGKGLDPEPSSFRDEGMDVLSPLQAYNVIKLGVDGTGMQSYDALLNEYEIWDLAFYVMSMRYDVDKGNAELPLSISLDSVSKWSDNDLRTFLQANGGVDLALIRGHEPVREAPLDIAKKELDNSIQIYRTGNKKQAEKHALTSYLEGVELVENILNSTSPQTVNAIERNMVLYRRAMQQGNDLEVERLYLVLKDNLQEAEEHLDDLDYSFAFIYGAALSILIREALEALLIILIIISILKPLGIKNAITAVHIGWMSAVALGFLGWMFVDYLVGMSGASRELMEGIGAIIAVIVLLYAGTWLHSHSEVSKWTGFVKNKVEKIKESGNWIGLSLFSFIVVFREAFEVVLFLSSLKLNNPEKSGPALMWALISAIVIVAIITYIFMKTTKKLPINKIFKISAYVIAVLAVVLTGKGVSALQEAGWISVHHLDFIPKIDLIGIYPTIETIVAQLLVLFIIVFFTKRNNKK